MATFESPGAFSFHSINAWQEPYSEPGKKDEVDIICEVIQFPSTDILYRLYYDILISTGPGVSSWVGTADRTSIMGILCRYRLANVPTGTTKNGVATAELMFKANAPLIGTYPPSTRCSQKPATFTSLPIKAILCS